MSDGLKLGNVYTMFGYQWIPVTIAGHAAIMQSLGVTSGKWPGYVISGYNSTKGTVTSYDTATEVLGGKLSCIEYSDAAKGLYIPANTCTVNSYWKAALLKAAGNAREFDIDTIDGVWFGDSCDGEAIYLQLNGEKYFSGYDRDDAVIAPAFNLDLTKIVIKGNKIVAKDWFKEPANSASEKCSTTKNDVNVRSCEMSEIVTDYSFAIDGLREIILKMSSLSEDLDLLEMANEYVAKSEEYLSFIESELENQKERKN